MSPPIGAPVHFHIRWSGSAGLDFFRFSSREEADESAKMWVRGNEAYSIEEFGDSCERCAALLDKMTKKTRPS
ncbi:MAG TPA: hypothetical protein VGR93_02390 [Candidatus Acidoferrales bacterium]|nr:hypothetical protein [Candidatus Acidoferrales bacterium]